MNGMSREELEARFGSSQAVTDARVNALLERMDAAAARSAVQFDNLVEAIRDIRTEMRAFRIEIRADMDERFRQFVEAGERNRELLRLDYGRQHDDFRAQLGEWRVQNDKMTADLRAEWQQVASALRAEGQQVSRELRAEARADLRDLRATIRNALIASIVTSISACLATIFGVAAVVGNMMASFESGTHMGGAQADLQRQVTEVDARLTRSTEELKRQIADTDARLAKSTEDLTRQIADVDARLAKSIAETNRQFAETNRQFAATTALLKDLQRRLPPPVRK